MAPRGDHLDRLLADFANHTIDRRQFIRRGLALGLSLPAVGALLAACQGGSSSGGGGSSSVSTEVLKLRLDDDIENLDPAVQPGHSDGSVATNIFENLVGFKPATYEAVNVLAEKWEGSSDGLTWEFTLKQGIQFQGNYGEVTADDVKFSFERIAGVNTAGPKIKSPYQSDWASLKEVRVKDKYSGTVVLKEPYAPLMTTTVPGQSGQIVSMKAVTERGNDKFGTHPIGTGPYEFVSWSPKQNVKLKTFDGYSGAGSDAAPAPVWKTLEFLVIGEDNPAVIALESGAVDFSTLPTSAVSRLQSNDQFDVVKQASLNYNWIGMNITHPNLKDVNVRNAVMWGIDVPSIIQAVYDGLTEQATAMIAPGMPIGYWKDAPTYERDVDKAKGFLEQAGKVGQELVMSASNAEPGAATLAQIVQQNLNEVGFKVTVNIQDGAVFDSATKAANQKKQLFYTGFTTLPDPEWVTTWFTCSQVNVWNYMSWCNDEYSSLDKKGATTVDPDERNTMYIRMQQLMDEAKCALWVTWPTVYFAVKKGITPAIDPGAFFQAHGFQTA